MKITFRKLKKIYKIINFINYGKTLFIFYMLISILSATIVNVEAGDILRNDEEMWLESGESIQLSEGYNLTVTIIDRDNVNISISKNGKLVHNKVEQKGYPYIYMDKATNKKILRFRAVDINNNKIHVKNIYQYSDGRVFTSTVPSILTSPTTESNLDLVEDSKTLIKDEIWNVDGGWAFKTYFIDSKEKYVGLIIYRNGNKFDEKDFTEGKTYNYPSNLSIKIESIFTQSATDFVELKVTHFALESTLVFGPNQTITPQTISPKDKNYEFLNGFKGYFITQDFALIIIIIFNILYIIWGIWKLTSRQTKQTSRHVYAQTTPAIRPKKVVVLREYRLKSTETLTNIKNKKNPIHIRPAELIGPAVEMKNLGWIQKGKDYSGYFTDITKKYEGRIELDAKRIIYMSYIRNPPKNVFRGPHAHCFREKSGGWYWIHLNNPSSDPVLTIRIVNNVIRNPLQN